MSRVKANTSTGRLLYSVVILTLVTMGFCIFLSGTNSVDANSDPAIANAVPEATFPANAGTLGAIPDSDIGSPICQNNSTTMRDVTFTASGLTGSISSVSVNFSASHTYLQDLEVSLIAPSAQSLLLFSATGTTTTVANSCAGNTNDLSTANTYTFADSATANWWTTAASGNPVPTSSNRTVITGIGGAANPPATTSLNTAFAAATPNGTWTLRFRDRGAGDTGSVTAASLTVTTAAAVTQKANVDMNGDGKSDFVVARATAIPFGDGSSSGFSVNRGVSTVRERRALDREQPLGENVLAPPIYWYVLLNGSGATGVAGFGDAAIDLLTPADFDGDGKTDIAIWRPGAATVAGFWILQSSTSTATMVKFGQDGDDPAIVGDYDGDGKADPAVYRCPPFGGAAGQCYFFYRGSNANPSGNVTYVPWGFGVDGDFFVNTGDFDGDGKNDFCIQRTAPGSATAGQFVLLKSNGLGVEYINWGLNSDFIIPGDYDADGKSDFCVRRTVSGIRQHWVLLRTGATFEADWGVTGDQEAPGDYDGDGKQDFAIWRMNADPTQNFFWIRRSSDGVLMQPEWGQSGDVAVAGWYVH